MFQKIEGSGTERLPYFKDWVKTIPIDLHPKLVDIEFAPKVIKEASSGKGFILEFENFAVFVWGNSSQGHTIEKMFDEKDGFVLGICIRKTKKSLDYDIGFLTDAHRIYDFNYPQCDELSFLTIEEAKEKKARMAAAKKNKEEMKKMQEETLKNLDEILASRK